MSLLIIEILAKRSYFRSVGHQKVNYEFDFIESVDNHHYFKAHEFILLKGHK